RAESGRLRRLGIDRVGGQRRRAARRGQDGAGQLPQGRQPAQRDEARRDAEGVKRQTGAFYRPLAGAATVERPRFVVLLCSITCGIISVCGLSRKKVALEMAKSRKREKPEVKKVA